MKRHARAKTGEALTSFSSYLMKFWIDRTVKVNIPQQYEGQKIGKVRNDVARSSRTIPYPSKTLTQSGFKALDLNHSFNNLEIEERSFIIIMNGANYDL